MCSSKSVNVTVEEIDKMEEKQRNSAMFFQFNNSAIQSNVSLGL